MRPLQTLFLLAGAAIATHAANINLVANGAFEGGSLAGWTTSSIPSSNVTGSCNNGFAAQTTATGCVPGNNPIFGSTAAYSSTAFPAISNSLGQWTNELYQSILIPTVTMTSATLTWADTATWSGTGGFRGVNVLVGFLDGNNQIANTFTVVNPNSSGSVPWATHSLDVTRILNARLGQTITLRLMSIAFFDTRSSNFSSATALNTGFDNVAINAVTPDAPVPEPATYVLMGTGLAAVALFRRKAGK